MFMWMAEGSLKPKREWSVKMVLSPMVPPCSSPSWHRIEKACVRERESAKAFVREREQSPVLERESPSKRVVAQHRKALCSSPVCVCVCVCVLQCAYSRFHIGCI